MGIKLRSLVTIVLCFTFFSVFAQTRNDGKIDAFSTLKSTYEKAGFKYTKIYAAKLIGQNNNYTINQNALLNFCDSLYNANLHEEAIFFLETGISLADTPPIRLKRYLASLYYDDGSIEKSKREVMEYTRMSNDLVIQRYLGQAGEQAIFSQAEQIIANYLEATGGREAWSQIQSMRITYTVQPDAGRDIKLIRYYKRPFFYRQEVIGSNSFTTTDGFLTWSCTDGEWRESSINYRFASIDNYSIDYKKLGIKYEMIGLEVLDSDPVYHLRRTFNDGFSQDLFFSAESGLLVETESIYPESHPIMESYFSAWDYREAGGVLIPHVYIRNVGEMGPPHGLVLSDIEINPDLPDSMFIPTEK